MNQVFYNGTLCFLIHTIVLIAWDDHVLSFKLKFQLFDPLYTILYM